MQRATVGTGMHEQACRGGSKECGGCCGAVNVCRRQRFKRRGRAVEKPLWRESVWATSSVSGSVASLSDLPKHGCWAPSDCAHKPVFTCFGCCCEGSTTFTLDLTPHPWSPAICGIPSHYGKQERDELVCFRTPFLTASVCCWHLCLCDWLIFALCHVHDLFVWHSHKCLLFFEASFVLNFMLREEENMWGHVKRLSRRCLALSCHA